jgi:hypothetical protein
MGGSDHEDPEFDGPTWEPTPLERIATFVQDQWRALDTKELPSHFGLIAAFVLLLGLVASPVVQETSLGSLSGSTWFDSLIRIGLSFGGQLLLLIPAIVALVLRSRLSANRWMRWSLRFVTTAASGLALFVIVYVAWSLLRMEEPRPIRATLLWMATGCALLVANVAVVFDDTETLS